MNKEEFEKLKEKYGEQFLEDTEQKEINDNDFENWIYTYNLK